jgi:hypothetical protein
MDKDIYRDNALAATKRAKTHMIESGQLGVRPGSAEAKEFRRRTSQPPDEYLGTDMQR